MIPSEELARLRPARTVVSVAGASARAQIRGWMAGQGFRETRDFICAA